MGWYKSGYSKAPGAGMRGLVPAFRSVIPVELNTEGALGNLTRHTFPFQSPARLNRTDPAQAS